MKTKERFSVSLFGVCTLLILTLSLNPLSVDGAASGTFIGAPTTGDCTAAAETAACDNICPEGVCDFGFSGMNAPLCLCNRVNPGGSTSQCTLSPTQTPGGPEPCDFFAGIFPPNDPTVPTVFNCVAMSQGISTRICTFSDNTLAAASITPVTDSPSNNNNSSSNTGLINCAKLPTQFSSVGEALFCLVKAAVVKLKFLFLPKIIFLGLLKLLKLALVAVASILSGLSLVAIGGK